MPIEAIGLNTSHLHLWADGKSGLLLHDTLKQLTLLEPLPLALLLALDQGCNSDEAIQLVRQSSQLRSTQIEAVIDSVNRLLKPTINSTTYADGNYPELAIGQSHPHAVPALVVNVAGASFALESEDGSFLDEIQHLLSPIACESGMSPDTIDFSLAVKGSRNRGFSLVSNGIEVAENLAYEQLMPPLIDRIQILAYQQSGYCFGFHGAALERTRNGATHYLLIPGASGAGKSTLTATLAANGYQVYSDEIIAIKKNRQLTQLRLPIALKAGSWPAIARLFPAISSQTEWSRLDGRRLKYLWPDGVTDHSEQSTPGDMACASARQIVNPCFGAGVRPASRSLSTIETIALMTRGGYQLGVELSADWVEELIEFCESVNAYQISYSNSTEALDLLSRLDEP